tara:strand:- start:679 stop:801 length:123 start_codon:yes stop_codon:yes gene_type:complete
MKIGFYSANYNTLGKFWQKLKDKGVKNISHHLEKYVKNLS